MLWEKVIVEESGWCWWWLVPAAEPPGSTVTLEWALRRTVPATAVSDLSMHNCVPMQCKSHCADAHCIAHWTINIAVSMWGRWSTEAASCCTFPRRLKRATQSDRGALLSFPLLFCSQLDVRAATYLGQIGSAHCTKSCVYCAILSTSGCCHIFFETRTTPSVFLCRYCLFISLTNSSQAFISALFNIC